MHEYDVPSETSGLAEIVCRHHYFDAARGDGADDVLDRLGGGGIETRGRLVEQAGDVAARSRWYLAVWRPSAAAQSRRSGPSTALILTSEGHVST